MVPDPGQKVEKLPVRPDYPLSLSYKHCWPMVLILWSNRRSIAPDRFDLPKTADGSLFCRDDPGEPAQGQ
jgi:hypothetical protein